MRLYVKPLLNFTNANNFTYGNQWIVRSGDPLSLYFQLFDLDQGPANIIGGPIFQGSGNLSGNIGLRYIPGIGGSNQPVQVVVTFPSIDDTKIIQAVAIQDANDASIFKVVLASTQLPASGAVTFAVSEGSATRKFNALNLLTVEQLDDGSC